MDERRPGTEKGVRCTGCARAMECCCFCDEPDCPVPICYACLMDELKQSMAQPHAHGG